MPARALENDGALSALLQLNDELCVSYVASTCGERANESTGEMVEFVQLSGQNVFVQLFWQHGRLLFGLSLQSGRCYRRRESILCEWLRELLERLCIFKTD